MKGSRRAAPRRVHRIKGKHRRPSAKVGGTPTRKSSTGSRASSTGSRASSIGSRAQLSLPEGKDKPLKSNHHPKAQSQVVRFGVSLEKELLSELDGYVAEKGFPTRSEAVRALVRERLVEGEWETGKEVAGAIVLVYDHGRHEIVNKITRVQHVFHKTVLSTQHVHLDHDNCLEVVVVKGRPGEVRELYRGLQAIKGMKHVSLSAGTTGQDIP